MAGRGGGSRAQVLELAILGQLQRTPMHGYELRKQLNAQLGTFRTLSYGSLYPALRRLTEASLIAEIAGDTLPHALAGRRAKIVYELTADGSHHLAGLLSRAEPESWEDDAFDVRFALFSATDARTRLRILEGRHTRMVERLEMLRTSTQRTWERMDAYTAELARHGLEQVEHEVRWLEGLIDTERGTRGALDFRTGQPPPGGQPPAADQPSSQHTTPKHPGTTDRPDATNTKETP